MIFPRTFFLFEVFEQRFDITDPQHQILAESVEEKSIAIER